MPIFVRSTWDAVPAVTIRWTRVGEGSPGDEGLKERWGRSQSQLGKWRPGPTWTDCPSVSSGYDFWILGRWECFSSSLLRSWLPAGAEPDVQRSTPVLSDFRFAQQPTGQGVVVGLFEGVGSAFSHAPVGLTPSTARCIGAHRPRLQAGQFLVPGCPDQHPARRARPSTHRSRPEVEPGALPLRIAFNWSHGMVLREPQRRHRRWPGTVRVDTVEGKSGAGGAGGVGG